jgi:multidrug resistance efflux pump
MLNISKISPNPLRLDKFSSAKILVQNDKYKKTRRFLVLLLILFIIFLLLPWTQNTRGSGQVTTLKPNQRPQTIQTIISGKIEKWYVNEGDYVKKGDTILFISEVKEDYLDPNLVDNTKGQVEAKRGSSEAYASKVGALNNQIDAMQTERNLKFQQAQNKFQQANFKVKSDSIDYKAAQTQIKIAKTQYERSIALYQEGLRPLSDLEDKRMKLQDAEAKLITSQNKLLTSRNELINATLELNRINAEYGEKIAKTNSDIQSTLGAKYDTDAQVNKLKNQYANYVIRNNMYYILAPQDGYVNRAIQSGIGEIIKEGTAIVSIMPKQFEIAIETFVSPVDYPLIRMGEGVRIWFDGWPNIVFSGWPDMSYGTFGGIIVAKENFISENGKFRVLVAPDPKEKAWPKELSIGAGAQSIILLETVPVWYEMWRTLNGFPPDYYNPGTKKEKEAYDIGHKDK